jgi:hypothetical protein
MLTQIAFMEASVKLLQGEEGLYYNNAGSALVSPPLLIEILSRICNFPVNIRYSGEQCQDDNQASHNTTLSVMLNTQ